MSLPRVDAAAAAADTTATNLFSFLFAPPPAPELTPSDKRFEDAARQCVAMCRIEALFDDSKFLGTDALRALVAAVAAATGPTSAVFAAGGGGTIFADSRDLEATSAEAFAAGGVPDLEVAEAYLELLLKLAIRNRDRIHVILPVLQTQIQRIVRATVPATAALTQRAVVGLLRVCTRLLMYRQDVTDQLVDCLKVCCALRRHCYGTKLHFAGLHGA
jgi:golgi-specific brefeldin A-resistance guanine nucleotide exchange factor 1